MTRRSTLPGAAELFRSSAQPVEAQQVDAQARDARPATDRELRLASDPLTENRPSSGVRQTAAVRRPVADRQPSGRQRHDEKITVYVSPDELVDLEQARLNLRAEYGLAVDRGRIVREALAMILADLEANGDKSTLVQRLTGR